ncbi:uncharacterized protein LOC107424324 [Ziziphus jujuba]|uniref:Uncharacterized protein LOC107424324 n=2 Tax=Ziziphus jujuba TaxID=326968 RepID=A0A6P4A7L3_ZIZJJ|nr:uncharacterized protein LOC107424324 [Ziziphus jujuba]KAH7519843.1 hypothetical protein FEM48_Zijuj08G0080300 [Ziziphus jujuba var. spinosa]
MAISSSLPVVVHPPVRSISLPTREHPSSIQVEALLNHLKSCQFSLVSTPVRFAAETIQTGLVGLADLYTCLEEFITQQALLPNGHGNVVLVEEALDGSITLLDTCNIAREILLTMNEHVQRLQSALRRKGRDSSIETSIHAYISYRKNAKKEIIKCLAALKRMDRSNINSSSPLLDLDHQPSMVAKILRETSTITISIFRALLEFLSVPATKTKAGGWSMISKLMPIRSSSSSEKEKKIGNLVGGLDFALYSLVGNLQSTDTRAEVEMAQRMLETFSLTSEGIVGGLDCMFRCLVQHRVSLLNILTQ